MPKLDLSKGYKVEFVRHKDYTVYPVSGSWGGVTPQGYVKADLYIESFLAPERLPVTFEPEDQKHEEVEDPVMVRELLSGFYMRPEVAHAIGRWLINKAKEAGHDPEGQ